MSTDSARDKRDLSGELTSPKAGHSGIPFDAVCTGCQKVHVKQARPLEVGLHPQIDPETIDATDCNSFKHVCHRCQRCTWWNPVAVLTGLIRTQRED